MNKRKMFITSVLLAVFTGFAAGYLALCFLHEMWFNHKLANQCKRRVEILYAALEAQNKQLRLPVGREVFTLNPFGEVSPRTHYFGEYVIPTEFLGGTMLHLFPNGRFVISKWSDIGPDELQASGSFQVRGDSLSLQFSRIRHGSEDLKEKFSGLHILWGRMEKKDYVTGFEVFVFPSGAWETLRANPEKAPFLQRRTEYNDWQKILKAYETQNNETSIAQ